MVILKDKFSLVRILYLLFDGIRNDKPLRYFSDRTTCIADANMFMPARGVIIFGATIYEGDIINNWEHLSSVAAICVQDSWSPQE